MVWIEVTRGTVADRRDLMVGQIVEVSDLTARRLVYAGAARVVEPPPADVPVVQARARTR